MAYGDRYEARTTGTSGTLSITPGNGKMNLQLEVNLAQSGAPGTAGSITVQTEDSSGNVFDKVVDLPGPDADGGEENYSIYIGEVHKVNVVISTPASGTMTVAAGLRGFTVS